MKLVTKDHLSSSYRFETFCEWFKPSDFLLTFFSPERKERNATLGLVNVASSRLWITFFHVSVHFIVIMNKLLCYCNSIKVYPRPGAGITNQAASGKPEGHIIDTS